MEVVDGGGKADHAPVLHRDGQVMPTVMQEGRGPPRMNRTIEHARGHFAQNGRVALPQHPNLDGGHEAARCQRAAAAAPQSRRSMRSR
jgi:hypothetical protein